MFLESIRLYQFRCFGELLLEPKRDFNVVSGLNGQGKTSILEAVGLLGSLKSFRHAKNQELIQFGQAEALVTGSVRNGELSGRASVQITSTRKHATFNGKSCKYLSEYLGKLSVVSFSPADLEIAKGSPEFRRAWVDKFASIYFPEHSDLCARYGKVLENRNRILKQLSLGHISAPPDDFDVWSEELARLGAEVIHNRVHTVDNSVEKIGQYYSEIAGQNTSVSIRYFSKNFDQTDSFPGGQERQYFIELVGQTLRKLFVENFRKDSVLGLTSVGPHRDDLEFLLGGNDIRAFGSQGEVRSFVLALRLAEVEAFESMRGLNPVLLIDDFSSELDSKRRDYLLEYLNSRESQVFLSTTELLDLGKTFLVSKGRIVSHDDWNANERRQQL